jgi:thiosulfate dehydrogenase
MFKGFITGVLATVVVGLACVYIVVKNGLVPINADSPPLPGEVWAAQTALDAALARQAPKTPNPVALTDDNLVAGINLYAKNCAICHGTAKGDASASGAAKGLNPDPPQFGSGGVEDDPEGETFWKVQHGIRWTGMPAWKKTLSDQQIWTIALFLKNMKKLPPAAQQAWQGVQN